MAFSDTGRGDRSGDPQGPKVDGTEGEFESTGFAGVVPEGQPSFEEPPQLELGDEDVRLPWLEGDDDEFEDERGSGMSQGLLLGVFGLLAIAVIVGIVFWAMNGSSDKPLVADGGVIAAPKEPYKTKPENPGGEVVAGTGDTSFAVAEGQSRQPQIGEQEEVPGPGFESVDKPAEKPAEKASAPAKAPAPVSGIGVQVGAYTSKQAAETGWNTLKTQYPDLSGMNHRVLEGQADIGTVYRLQAVPGDLAAAKALCSGMKNAGLSCQVKN